MKKILIAMILVTVILSSCNGEVKTGKKVIIDTDTNIVVETNEQDDNNKLEETVVETNTGAEDIQEDSGENIIVKEQVSVGISLIDLEKHNTIKDCWTLVNSKVYDISSFFGKHPGGDIALSKICGIDGTKLFTAQHGGNEKVEKLLETFYKGEFGN